MITERRRQLEREIADAASELRQFEQTLDQTWYRNLVRDGEEMVEGMYGALATMPLECIGDVIRLLELRGTLRGIAQYGGLITGRLDNLKQTLEQLKVELDHEPEDE